MQTELLTERVNRAWLAGTAAVFLLLGLVFAWVDNAASADQHGMSYSGLGLLFGGRLQWPSDCSDCAALAQGHPISAQPTFWIMLALIVAAVALFVWRPRRLWFVGLLLLGAGACAAVAEAGLAHDWFAAGKAIEDAPYSLGRPVIDSEPFIALGYAWTQIALALCAVGVFAGDIVLRHPARWSRALVARMVASICATATVMGFFVPFADPPATGCAASESGLHFATAQGIVLPWNAPDCTGRPYWWFLAALLLALSALGLSLWGRARLAAAAMVVAGIALILGRITVDAGALQESEWTWIWGASLMLLFGGALIALLTTLAWRGRIVVGIALALALHQRVTLAVHDRAAVHKVCPIRRGLDGAALEAAVES